MFLPQILAKCRAHDPWEEFDATLLLNTVFSQIPYKLDIAGINVPAIVSTLNI